MRTLKSQRQRYSWLNYAALTGLLVGLFLVGLGLGNQVFASLNQVGPAAGADGQSSGAAAVNPPFQVRDFALTNQNGTPTSLKDLRGRVVILFFGYTHCPDVCPTTIANFTLVKKLLGAEADRVTFVFVTIDSQRDTPTVIKEFLNHFDTGFIGLTGDEVTLHSMAAEYGGYFSIPTGQKMGDADKDHHEEGVNNDNYFVEHTSPSYLIDPKGFLRTVFFYGTSSEVIAKGIQQILQEDS